MNKQIRFIQIFALSMAVLVIPTLATAATTIKVASPAVVVSNGVGAIVELDFTCDLGPNSVIEFANVQLFERVGNLVTNGFGSANNNETIDCDGTPQPVQILVPSSGRRFRKGTAIAEAAGSVCTSDLSVCEFAQDTEEIELVIQK